jgi:hypothetical protein
MDAMHAQLSYVFARAAYFSRGIFLRKSLLVSKVAAAAAAFGPIAVPRQNFQEVFTGTHANEHFLDVFDAEQRWERSCSCCYRYFR